jgi:hypothetical protein
MESIPKDSGPLLDTAMSVLDVLVQDRRTEAVFRSYGDKIGVCLCCEALFLSLEEVASTYGLNREALLRDLEACLDTPPDSSARV